MNYESDPSYAIFMEIYEIIKPYNMYMNRTFKSTFEIIKRDGELFTDKHHVCYVRLINPFSVIYHKGTQSVPIEDPDFLDKFFVILKNSLDDYATYAIGKHIEIARNQSEDLFWDYIKGIR